MRSSPPGLFDGWKLNRGHGPPGWLFLTVSARRRSHDPPRQARGDPEWFERPEWFAVRDVYGLKFARQRNFSPTFMYDALRSDEADVITAYTSDGRISADRLRVLEDPREALPSYDTLIILSPERANDEKLIAALRPLLGSINVENMREANFSVDRTDGEKKTPAEAARALAKASGQE